MKFLRAQTLLKKSEKVRISKMFKKLRPGDSPLELRKPYQKIMASFETEGAVYKSMDQIANVIAEAEYSDPKTGNKLKVGQPVSVINSANEELAFKVYKILGKEMVILIPPKGNGKLSLMGWLKLLWKSI